MQLHLEVNNGDFIAMKRFGSKDNIVISKMSLSAFLMKIDKNIMVDNCDTTYKFVSYNTVVDVWYDSRGLNHLVNHDEDNLRNYDIPCGVYNVIKDDENSGYHIRVYQEEVTIQKPGWTPSEFVKRYKYVDIITIL